jgi:Fe-S cluster assembly iron-binding protein IscA
MLRITPEAGLTINRLAEREGATADGGVRIETLSTEHGNPTFALSMAVLPDELDQVVSEPTTGARVLLDSLTAEYVTELVLDADDTVDGTGRQRLRPVDSGST